MKPNILENLNQPAVLENMYRGNKLQFKRNFLELYPEISEHPVAQTWHARLQTERDGLSWGASGELILVCIATLIAFIVARAPELFSLDESFYYSRNLSFTVFPLLGIYFGWKNKLTYKTWIIPALILVSSILFINLLPDNEKSDTVFLSIIHLPLLLWALVGYMYTGGLFSGYQRRVDFLRFNGDLLVLVTVLYIAGAILTALTLGLFSIINVDITDFYFKYVVIWGLVAAPILAAYLIRMNPSLVANVSPVVAQLFTPLVLVTLSVYLVAMLGSGENPYKDRDFLIIFNIMLIGVMAIVLFSLAEWLSKARKGWGSFILFALVALSILVNGIALSAILFRIGSWGITPNRLAVLGGNGLILGNLLLIAYFLFHSLRGKHEAERIERSIAWFLPLYFSWCAIVVFLFPVIFWVR